MLILVLILSLVAVLATSGAASAAGATTTTHTWMQIPLAPPTGGTTWTEGGITHVRGQALYTWCFYDYDGDGLFDDGWTVVYTTSLNSNRDATGAGVFWGTWSEYDYYTGDVLVDGGTFWGQYTCFEGLDEPEAYDYGWVNLVSWGFGGPNRDWGHTRGTAILYSEPLGSLFPLVFLGEASFLVPGGK